MEELTLKKIIWLSAGLAAVLIFIAWLVLVVIWQQDLAAVFTRGRPIPDQFYHGLVLGAVAGSTSLIALNKLPFLAELRRLFENIISKGQITLGPIMLISFMAGVSEELLFRAVMQPVLGIWWTSFIFIGLHGYFNPFNWRTTCYGLLMFAVSVGLGFLYEMAGLVSAITAHTLIDIIILWGLAVNKQQ